MAPALCMLAMFTISTRSAAQISPGPLARPHAELEGNRRCFECHGSERGASPMNEQCLDCHEEIAWQVERGLGLHGLEKKRDCAGCHPDHAGPDFELISWEEGRPEAFDHDRTGWPLDGRHAALQCRECHKAEFRRAPVARLSKRKDPDRSWLGLERACLSCHEDYHRGTLDQDCGSCHRHTKWKPAASFDHAASAFPLTGKHAEVACAKCHLVPGRIALAGEDGRPVPRYKPVPHAECSACHDDLHRGRLGPKCADCHTTDDFKRVDRAAFDHARTRYPLRGRHADLECAQCHDPRSAWGERPAFERCGSCHREAHAGTATRAGRVVDCASCHDEKSFRPATYTVADHRGSAYPLEGKHASVRCDRCHVKNPPGIAPAELGTAGVRIRPAHAECRDCHADAHAGQLARRAAGDRCESCHTVDGWKPSSFTAEQHAALDLPLEGRHLDVPCASCHGPVRANLPALPGAEVLGSARVALTALDAGCRTCHLDPHAGRFAVDGERPHEEGCRGCHDARAFRPSRVDVAAHDGFAYPLEGGHRAVPCVLCHEELKAAPSSIELLRARGPLRALRFAIADRRCAACHRTPHGDQFAQRAGGGACEDCHGIEAFRPATRFDHDRDASFALGRGHRDVACARCHPTVTASDGSARVVYRPVSQRCRDCHGKKVPGERPARGTS